MEATRTILEQDLDDICFSDEIEWEKYKNKTILVTGATGLIGSLLCKCFLNANKRKNLNIQVLAFVRNKQKAEKLLEEELKDPMMNLVVGNIALPVSLDNHVDMIFHCASVTASKMMVSQPVETIRTAIEGTRNLLELAKEKQVDTFVYVSSMEVYGVFESLDHDVSENDLGYINPLVVRSNYPESKRMCENMCVAYLKEYGVHTRIARLAQTFGAGILPGESRVFAQFAKSAISGESIVLHTLGKSEGNYCYTSDCIKGLLVIALKGQDGEAYNVSNPKAHTTIADMAKMVAEEFGQGKCEVIFDIPVDNVFGYAADTKMRLSSDKLQSLGWTPKVGLMEAYERMIRYLNGN